MNTKKCKKIDACHLQLGDLIVGWDTKMKFPEVTEGEDLIKLTWTCGAHIWIANMSEIADIAFPGTCQEGSIAVYHNIENTRTLVAEACHKGVWHNGAWQDHDITQDFWSIEIPPKRRIQIMRVYPTYLLLIGDLHKMGYPFGNRGNLRAD